MPNFEKRPKQAFEKSEESIAERREETAETAIAGDSEKPQREAFLKQQAQEQQTHDSQEAAGLLEKLKNKYGERYVEERSLKPGDEVYADGEFLTIDRMNSYDKPEPLLPESPEIELKKDELRTQLEIETRRGLSGEAKEEGIGGIKLRGDSELLRRANQGTEMAAAEAQKKKEHEEAQLAAAGRSFIAIRPDEPKYSPNREKHISAMDVTKATPELKERINKMKPKWWNPISW